MVGPCKKTAALEASQPHTLDVPGYSVIGCAPVIHTDARLRAPRVMKTPHQPGNYYESNGHNTFKRGAGHQKYLVGILGKGLRRLILEISRDANPRVLRDPSINTNETGRICLEGFRLHLSLGPQRVHRCRSSWAHHQR